MLIRGARLTSKMISSINRASVRYFSNTQNSGDSQEQDMQELLFPYQFGNRMELVQQSELNIQALPFNPELLEKKGFIEGFKYAYSRFLSGLVFKDEQFLEAATDSSLLLRFTEGTQDLEKNEEKLILKAADGSIIKTMQHFDAICEEEDRFQIQTKLINFSVMQTPIWGREIDTKNYQQEFQSFTGPHFKMIVPKGGYRFDLALRSQFLLHIVLGLTFEIKSDLILQTLPFKHKPERARPVKPQTHYIQFEGKVGQLSIGTSDLFSQLKKQITGNMQQKALENLQLEDIIITDFDNYHKGSRWLQ